MSDSSSTATTTTNNVGSEGYTMTSLSVEVVDYMILDDPNYYNSHVFTLQIWMEQNMYKIQRSYASFLELDKGLRRKYPRSALPSLSLAGVKDSGGSNSGGSGSGNSSKSKRFSIKLTSSKDKDKEKDKDKDGGGEGMNTRASLYGNDLRASMIEVDPSTIAASAANSAAASSSSSSSSSSNSEGKKKLIKRIDNHEVISQKKSVLTYYLRDLLKIPEVLVSSTLLYFLDEESNDGDIIVEDITNSSTTTEHQLCYQTLLQDEVKTIKTVRKDFRLTIPVEAGQVVIWSFETKLRDIGFAVYFNDDNEVATYQRYNSHECKIFGSFEVPALPEGVVSPPIQNKIELVWDNSYSKFHSKTLIYMTKVCAKETYDLVMMTAERMKKVKRQFAQQRKTLQRVLQKVATEILSGGNPINPSSSATSSSISSVFPGIGDGLTSIEEEHDDEDGLTVPKRGSIVLGSGAVGSSSGSSSQQAILMEQLEKLRNEKQFLQLAYSECETALVAERSACAEKQQQVDDLQLAKDLLDEELFETKSELENLRMELNEVITSQMAHTAAVTEAHKLSIDQLLTGNTSEGAFDFTKQEIAIANFQQLLQYTRELSRNLSETRLLVSTQEQQLNKLKVEKKQLKTLGIQLREKSDLLILEKTQLEHEKDLVASQYQTVTRECSEYKALLEERDKEIVSLKQSLEQLQQQQSPQSLNESTIDNKGSTSGGATVIPIMSTSLSPSPATVSSSVTASSMEQRLSIGRQSFSGSVVAGSNNNNINSVSVSVEEINAAMIESAMSNASSSAAGGGSLDGGSVHSADTDENQVGVNPLDPYGFNSAANQPNKTIVIDFAKTASEPDELSFLLSNMTSSLMDMMPSWGSSSSSSTTAATSSSTPPGNVNSANASSSVVPNKGDGTQTEGSGTDTKGAKPAATTTGNSNNTSNSMKSRSGSITSSFAGSTFRGMTFGF